MKALVVGGNSGIGLALVLKLIKKGYKHVYVVGKDQPKEEDLGDMLAEFNAKTTFYKVNLINGLLKYRTSPAYHAEMAFEMDLYE